MRRTKQTWLKRRSRTKPHRRPQQTNAEQKPAYNIIETPVKVNGALQCKACGRRCSRGDDQGSASSHRSPIWSIILLWASRKNLDWAWHVGPGCRMRWSMETPSAKGILTWLVLMGNVQKGGYLELTICRHMMRVEHGNRSDKIWDEWMTFIVLCFRFILWNHILYYVVSNFKSSSSNIANNLSTFTSAYKVSSIWKLPSPTTEMAHKTSL